jgi:hypothetical protein
MIRVKDCNFQIVPISGIINQEELNPFEGYTILRKGYKSTYFNMGEGALVDEH